MKIRVMSFNTQHCLNYITREIDFDRMVEAIQEVDADIIGLNEMHGRGTDPEYEAQTEILAAKLGYQAYFAKACDIDGPNNPFGNGILSKYPILKAESVPIPDPDPKRYDNDYYETRCILKAEIAVGEGLNILITHFGLNPDEAESAAKTVTETLEEEKCVLMGDFNLFPDSELLLPIREKMFDTAELFGTELLSFPSDKPNRKIDYIFTSKDVKVYAADIPAIVAADHRPYIADIEV